jgi:membrane protein DedA with SNARE-associated domain|tara:strand:- start:321 stop:1127 length:807 start_codon:yes stop_codon:yes gene_type:complete
MAESLQFLISYGYVVLFVWVMLDQVGLPLPAVPLLLAAGALAGTGQLSFLAVVVTVVLASLPGDLMWYLMGKARGGKVLNVLCGVSLEPDYCVRNTEALFDRLGLFSLLVAKFVPGLQTLAPPMAGVRRMSLGRFLVLDGLGAVIWAGLYTGIGFAFHSQLETAAAVIAALGAWAGFILAAILLLYVGYKFQQRRVFLRSLRMRRMHPAEVHERLNDDDEVYVIDLRHGYDYEALPEMVPSAVRVPMEVIDRHYHRIPKESDIILYCS